MTTLSKIVIPAWIHIRRPCLMPFGLMQICSSQICAGNASFRWRSTRVIPAYKLKIVECWTNESSKKISKQNSGLIRSSESEKRYSANVSC